MTGPIQRSAAERLTRLADLPEPPKPAQPAQTAIDEPDVPSPLPNLVEPESVSKLAGLGTVQQMSVAEHHQLANEHAQWSTAPELFKLRPIMTPAILDRAVDARSPLEVANAYRSLIGSGNDVRSLDSPQAKNAPAAGLHPIAAAFVQTTAVATLDTLSAQQAQAQQDVDALEAGMAEMAAACGPMTPEQYHAFCENYKAEHNAQSAYDALDQANAALADHIEKNQDSLLQAAQQDPAVAEQLANAMGNLAGTEHNEMVLGILQTIRSTEGSPLDQAFAPYAAQLDEASAVAIGQEYNEALAANGGDTDAAFNELMATTSTLQGYYFKSEKFKAGLELLQDIHSGNYDALLEYAQDAQNISSNYSGIFIALGSLIALARSGDTGEDTYALQVVQQSLAVGQAGLATFSHLLSSMALTGRQAQGLANAADVMGTFSRVLGPGAAVAGSVIATINAQGGNAGDGVALLGNYMQTFGAILCLVPYGAPAGLAISIAGAVVEAGGYAISDKINEEDRKQALIAAGVRPDVAATMAKYGPELIGMQHTLGMTPEQVQTLLVFHPEVGGSPAAITAFTLAAEGAGMSGVDALSFATELSRNDPNYMTSLVGYLPQLQAMTPTAAARAMREFVASQIPGMEAYIRNNSDVYSEQALTREQARIDYEGSFANDPAAVDATVVELLAKHSDPIYQAEIIGALAADGRLEVFIGNTQSIYGDRYDQAIGESIDAAEAQGTISAEEADAARDQLNK